MQSCCILAPYLCHQKRKDMANNDEFKRLGERFPNKNVGCGNPDAKILVVTQKAGNEDVDYQYLKKLFIKIEHFLNNGLDLLTEDVWREHLQLVTMTQNLLNKIIGWSYHVFKDSIICI